MFETAILGALPGSRLGVVRQCIECRERVGADAPQCPGFGAGCFLTPRPTQEAHPILERSGVL
jgi:hypothetical protein